MAGPTVYTDVAEDFDFASGGQLFAGKKFWVAQRVTSRNRLLDDIKANGGEIVVLEKKADYRIADHTRKDCPPGSISYKFVEESIKQGEVQDPADHPAGPPIGEAEEAGSIHQLTKSGRAAYTAEEDRILYKWVRDAEAAGGSVSGNEVYKQLAAKYPRHTWHSWRDRYLKQLRNRPPSAFNIPDNAPPSPPSDQSNERMPPAPVPSKPANQQTPKTEQTPDATTIGSKGKSKANPDYSVEELGELFSKDDWLECYAFVELIDSLKGQKEYEPAWAGWAELQGKQTVGQWQQYYEKVVRPQWLRDPVSKRERIRKQMEQKHDAETASGSQATGPQLSGAERSDETAVPPPTTAREEVHVKQPLAFEGERFEELLKQKENDRLSPDYTLYALETKTALETKMPSSSTARPESSNFYDDQLARFTKRLRENDFAEQEEEAEAAPPTKRRKSTSATPIQEDLMQASIAEGAQNQPVEISSAESSQSTSQTEDAEELMQEQIRSEVLDTVDDEATMVNLDGYPEEDKVESIESDDFPDIDNLYPPPDRDSESGEDLPSNTPTPRATRQRISNFDTQAILSSPIRDQFPRPPGYTTDVKFQQEQRLSSPAEQLESDASTTQSLQEFRCSLPEEDADQTLYAEATPQPLFISSSPAPSSTCSDSEDPDPPLTGDEIEEFYSEKNEEGFSNDFISKALKRTRLRPELASKVLDAWKVGKPLPRERGIWSIEDDAAVEGGDGIQLASLERKHTLDGWGGIMERLKFLEGYRSR